MRSGGLLLLLGLLTLWAELQPVSSQRPELCLLPADPGPCEARMPRFFFDSASGKCKKFTYGGCQGNANNFKTLKECRHTCVEKPGVCPKAPPNTVTICLAKCGTDWECPGRQKCCNYACLRDCRDPV